MIETKTGGGFTIAGILIGVLGVILFSAKAVMVKLAYQYEVDSLTLLLLRMGFSLPFYLVIAFIERKKANSKVKRGDLFLLIIMGIVGYYLASYFDFLGLQFISAGQERIVLFVYPTIVLLISGILLRKRINKYQIAAVLITYVGVIITFFPQLNSSDFSGDYIKGAGLVFLSAVTYATYLVGSGQLIPRIGATRFTAYAMIIACLSVIIHYAISGDFGFTSLRWEIYTIGFVMAILSTVIPSFLVSYSIKMMGAANFSVLGSLGPVFTIVLAYFILAERFTTIQIIGAIVVISGIYILSKQKQTLNKEID